MTTNKANVFVINIHPENWEACLRDHRFGIRIDVRHPKFNKGDIFIVRRTGKDYGVMGIWVFVEEKFITSQDEIPWDDSEYKWQQWFQPIIDFKTPLSEEFMGTSKFSQKLQISAMRLVGSVVSLNDTEVARYLDTILTEKAAELTVETKYDGKNMSASEAIRSLKKLPQKEGEKPVQQTATAKKERGLPVGEPINFRGMVYAPLNEAGVVLLFSKIMDDLGIIYESSPLTGFDMVGRQQTDKGFVQKNIEFEFLSSNFKAHGHDASLVDYLVCWKHDWSNCPQDLQVIELKEVIEDLPAQFSKGGESE